MNMTAPQTQTVEIGVKVNEIELIDGLFLLGAPGIGKTEIVRQKAAQMAKERNLKFVDLREATDEEILKVMKHAEEYCVFYRIAAPHLIPEDLGIPNKNINGLKYAEVIPQKVLAVLSTPNLGCGVLFIDEITNVQREDVMTLLFTLILEKEASWYLKLSRNVMVVAAGNPPEWSTVANPLPLPMRMGRLIPVRVSPPSVEDWIEHMNRTYGNEWEKTIGAYLMMYPGDFISPPSEDDGFTAVPSPRSWTKLALLLPKLERARESEEKKTISKEFIEQTIMGLVGPKAGVKVAALIFAKADIESLVNTVLANPSAFAKFNETQKILVVNAAAQDPIKFKGLAKFLAENLRDYFVMMLVLMPKERRLELLKDEDYKKLMQTTAKDLKKYAI